MTFPTLFLKSKQTPTFHRVEHIARNYFNASWELWKREISQALWDWAIDGPFCKDTQCGQRLEPLSNAQGAWQCIRCHARTMLPQHDLVRLRNHIIQVFEEEVRHESLQRA